jgi:tetratricopeptide (TPR) repeat protein
VLLGLLIIAASVGVLTWSERAAMRAGRHRALERAFAERNWPRVEKLTRERLSSAMPAADRASLQLALAHALVRLDRAGEAVDQLDPTLARALPARAMATWFNDRGYLLALCGRLDEADDDLDCAEVIVGDDEERLGRFLFTRVLGNRGLVRLRRGQLAEAEALIERAVSSTEKLAQGAGSSLIEQAREAQAERLVWLAEVAERRGDAALMRARLAEAASLDGTRFAERARHLLSA